MIPAAWIGLSGWPSPPVASALYSNARRRPSIHLPMHNRSYGSWELTSLTATDFCQFWTESIAIHPLLTARHEPRLQLLDRCLLAKRDRSLVFLRRERGRVMPQNLLHVCQMPLEQGCERRAAHPERQIRYRRRDPGPVQHLAQLTVALVSRASAREQHRAITRRCPSLQVNPQRRRQGSHAKFFVFRAADYAAAIVARDAILPVPAAPGRALHNGHGPNLLRLRFERNAEVRLFFCAHSDVADCPRILILS